MPCEFPEGVGEFVINFLIGEPLVYIWNFVFGHGNLPCPMSFVDECLEVVICAIVNFFFWGGGGPLSLVDSCLAKV